MSNSLKQSKVLLEGWRKFYLKEAEEPTAGGNVVRIFDFDGTIFKSKDPLLNNPLWRALMKAKDLQKFTKDEDVVVNSTLMEKLKETETNGKPVKKYIVSLIKSTGLPVSSYRLSGYIAGNDPNFMAFIRKIDKENELEKAKTAGPDGIKKFLIANTRLKDIVLDRAIAEKDELEEKVNRYREFFDAKTDEERNAVKKKYPGKQFQKTFKLDIAEQELKEMEEIMINPAAIDAADNDLLINVQKELINNFLRKNVEGPVEVFVKSNIAEYVKKSDSEDLELIKGTSGKRPLANKIASENKDSEFEIYDNDFQSLNDLAVGVLNGLGGSFEDEEPSAKEEISGEESESQIIQKLRPALKRLMSASKKAEAVSKYNIKRFLVSPSGGITDQSSKALTTGKNVSDEERAKREISGPQTAFKQVKNALFGLTYKQFVTKLSHGAPSLERKKQFENGYKSFFNEHANLSDVKEVLDSMLFSSEKSSTMTTAVISLMNDKYNNQKALTDLSVQVLEFVKLMPQMREKMKVAGVPTAESAPETGPSTQKTRRRMRAPDYDEPEIEPDFDSQEYRNIDQDEVLKRAAKRAGLDWSQMSYDEKQDFANEYYSEQDNDEALRETILKELRPLLAQLSKIANRKRK